MLREHRDAIGLSLEVFGILFIIIVYFYYYSIY